MFLNVLLGPDHNEIKKESQIMQGYQAAATQASSSVVSVLEFLSVCKQHALATHKMTK